MSGAPLKCSWLQPVADEYRIGRERRIAPRIERDVRAARPEVIVGSAERDVGVRDIRRRAVTHAEQPTFRPAAKLRALIVDLEVRVLALRDANDPSTRVNGPPRNVRSASSAARLVAPH